MKIDIDFHGSFLLLLKMQAAAVGFELLENDGVLPFMDSKAALYGSGARMTVKDGTLKSRMQFLRGAGNV